MNKSLRDEVENLADMIADGHTVYSVGGIENALRRILNRHPPADGVVVPRLLLIQLSQVASVVSLNLKADHNVISHAAELRTQADAILANESSKRREAPAEGESIPWAAYPDANFATADQDTEVVLHSHKPSEPGRDDVIWRSRGARWFPGYDGAKIPGPWQESLRARPANL